MAARALMLAGGLLPLLAPYELLIRPSWRGEITPGWLLFLSISAGAVAVSLLVVGAALLGLNQRVRFDSRSRRVNYAFTAAALPRRTKEFPFSAVEAIRVKTYEWTDGPPTYNLAATIKGYREIEFGRFTDLTEAEQHRAMLERLVMGTSPTRSV